MLLQWEAQFPELLTVHLSATSDQESCSLTSTSGSEQKERKKGNSKWKSELLPGNSIIFGFKGLH